MNRAELLQRLMATFLDELDEHVGTMNECLLSLEKEPGQDSTEVMKQLFRAAHSLKGAARAVEQLEIEQLCHHLEDVFTGLRDDRVSHSPELFGLMFSVADSVESAGMQLRSGETVDGSAMLQLIPRLQRAAVGEFSDRAASTDSGGVLSESLPGESAHNEPAAMDSPIDALVNPPTDDDASRKTISSGVKHVIGSDKIADMTPEDADPDREDPSGRRLISASIRVAEEKLDSLLAQAGELLVARQRIEGRADDVDAIQEFISAWKVEWQSVERTLRQIVKTGTGDPLLQRSNRLANRVTEVIQANGQRLQDLTKQLDQLKRRMRADTRQLNQAGSALHDDVHRVRMFPFAGACAGLERVVRDLARSTDKRAELVIEGNDIEVDRAVLEGLRDPLLHLVRNAVDHGIELPGRRQNAGKSPAGRVTVAASLRGTHVDISVVDDGQGLNLERIREKLIEQGRPVPREERELMRSVFLPGFSTASMITDVSGRGVGMDVVKSQVEGLHGTVDVSSQWGFGSRFLISVPLTLTTVSVLLVQVGRQTYAIPSTNVRNLVRFAPADIRSMEGRDVLPLGDAPVPVTLLASVLGSKELPEAGESGKLVGAVLASGGRQTVFVVDAVITEQEVVVKNLGSRIRRTRYATGATILRSGEIALLLNVGSLIRNAPRRTTTPADRQSGVHDDRRPGKLLVVDDSVTTRSLLKSVLLSAGYDVTAAVDGQDAWDRMQMAEFDLVVSDVDMPRMDGIRLTQNIRRGSRMQNTPVILVTSRDSADDKQRGADAGASAYLVKSSFDQSSILETIEQLL